ncbi:hypothetical protein K474DRAFT_1438844 [Panus rudis PR-1116 ss-1]|nr:hypothetical protein K474DRAFT_1438844 [Panus rudis PR-1116 ss-1]
MAMENRTIAVLTRTTLYIYRLRDTPNSPALLLCSSQVPISTGYAQLQFSQPKSQGQNEDLSREEPSLYACVSGEEGLFVFTVAYLVSDQVEWTCIWKHDSNIEGPLPIAIKPQFGAHTNTLSWLQHPFGDVRSHPTSFATATYTLSTVTLDKRSQTTSDVIIVHDKISDHMGLYFMTVWAYDETLGIAVIANGYGEMVFCSFAGGTKLVPEHLSAICSTMLLMITTWYWRQRYVPTQLLPFHTRTPRNLMST